MGRVSDLREKFRADGGRDPHNRLDRMARALEQACAEEEAEEAEDKAAAAKSAKSGKHGKGE